MHANGEISASIWSDGSERFRQTVQRALKVPAPDYGGRRLILRRVFEKLAGIDSIATSYRRTGDEANATLVCHATEGMTTGALFALVRDAETELKNSTCADPWRALLRRARDSSALRAFKFNIPQKATRGVYS